MHALSYGESELYALGAGCADGLYAQSTLNGMRMNLDVLVLPDASPAISLAPRPGLPKKLRQAHMKHLFALSFGKSRMTHVKNVNTHDNVGEQGAKPLPADRLEYLKARVCKQSECEFRETDDSVNLVMHGYSVNLVDHASNLLCSEEVIIGETTALYITNNTSQNGATMSNTIFVLFVIVVCVVSVPASLCWQSKSMELVVKNYHMLGHSMLTFEGAFAVHALLAELFQAR